MLSRHCAFCWDWPCGCSEAAKQEREKQAAEDRRRYELWRASTTPAERVAEFQRTIVIPRHLLDE